MYWYLTFQIEKPRCSNVRDNDLTLCMKKENDCRLTASKKSLGGFSSLLFIYCKQCYLYVVYERTK